MCEGEGTDRGRRAHLLDCAEKAPGAAALAVRHVEARHEWPSSPWMGSIPGMRIRAHDLVRSSLLALGLVAVGCGGGKKDEKADDKSAEKTDEKSDAEGADAVDEADGGAAAVPSTTADDGAEAPPAEEGGGEGEAGAAEAGETGAAAGDDGAAAETGPAPSPEEQIKTLLNEVTNKRTKDDRAVEALDEAKGLGAEPKDLAKAANKRGEKLLVTPDRATKFFEWAAAADPKYPNATFNLAKLAANTGDIPKVKELLTEVKARGGKKLLQQIEFDPSFALVADDPEVLSLLK
jgi:hypothetical protein